jgi:inosine-uridine nucleoside N-ribohydrolase
MGEAESVKKKVIIDCDVGVDDALALILAFHSPELDVQAVTGVNGNVPLDRVFRNIQKMLTLIRPPHKPWITKGADRPLTGAGVFAHDVHKDDGLGGAHIDASPTQEWWRSSPRPAHELICQFSREDPGNLTLIAVGPLTNVALALKEDPSGMRQLKEIIIMGGAVRTKGNITPYAEFNIFVDPLAAFHVFQSGLPITLIPLDVTRRVALTSRVIQEKVQPLKNAFSKFAIEATGFDFDTQEFYGRKSSFYLHDPLAVAAAFCPDILKMEKVDLRVVTEKGEHFGQTLEVQGESPPAKGRIDVGFTVDAEKFLDLFISRLKE